PFSRLAGILVSRHQLEDAGGLQDRSAADIKLSFAKGDRLRRARYPGSSLKPFAWTGGRQKIRIHPHGERHRLRFAPDGGTEQSVGKSHQHPAMRYAARIAVPFPDAHAMDEAVRRHLVIKWAV